MKTRKDFQKTKNETGIIEIHILDFDTHHKTIGNGNGNGKGRITTSAYEIWCHHDDSQIMKIPLTRCSEDSSNDFSFIPYGLP